MITAVAPDHWRLLREAAEAVAAVEARCTVLPPPRPGPYAVAGRVARRVGVPALDLPLERSARASGDPAPVGALPCSAVELRVGKFASHGRVRVRAFYRSAAGDELAVKVVTAPDLRRRVVREAAARCALADPLPGLAPHLVETGQDGDLAWLVERVVRGTHPLDGVAAERATRLVVPLLVRLHHAERTYVPVASVLTPASVHRLHAWVSVAHGGAPGGTELSRTAGRLAVAAERAVARHGTALVSRGWSHGDVVPSNVVLGPAGVTLVDWEFVGQRALGFDLVKLLSTRPAPEGHADDLADDLADDFAAAAVAQDGPPRTRLRRLRARRTVPTTVLPVAVQVAVAALRSAAGSATAADSAAASGRVREACRAVARRARVVERLAVRAGLLEA